MSRMYADDRFCESCGAPLRAEVRRVGYYSHNGKPELDLFLVCARKRWWSLGRHDDGVIFADWETIDAISRNPSLGLRWAES